MIALIGGIVLMVAGILATVWAIGRAKHPLVQLLAYAAGMAASIALLIAYTKEV